MSFCSTRLDSLLGANDFVYSLAPTTTDSILINCSLRSYYNKAFYPSCAWHRPSDVARISERMTDKCLLHAYPVSSHDGGSAVVSVVPHTGVRKRRLVKSHVDRELARRTAIPHMLSIAAVGQNRCLGRQPDRHARNYVASSKPTIGHRQRQGRISNTHFSGPSAVPTVWQRSLSFNLWPMITLGSRCTFTS